MAKYQIWDKESNIITPIGELLTPAQWIERYPAAGVESTKWVVSDGVINGGVMMEFSTIVEYYSKRGCDFSGCVTDQDYLDAIADFEDTPQQAEPDANERIAAALEFQNAITMLDLGLSIEPSIVAKNYERHLWSAEQVVLALGETAIEVGVPQEEYNKTIQVLEAKEAIIKGVE